MENENENWIQERIERTKSKEGKKCQNGKEGMRERESINYNDSFSIAYTSL